MNLIGIIILVTLVAVFLLNFAAEYLNLRCQAKELPESVRGVYSPEKYQKSKDYLRTRTRFGWVSTAFDLLLLLGFWFAGGFEMLDSLVRQWGGGPVVTGGLYIGSPAAVKALAHPPVSNDRPLWIEARFGFPNATG